MESILQSIWSQAGIAGLGMILAFYSMYTMNRMSSDAASTQKRQDDLQHSMLDMMAQQNASLKEQTANQREIAEILRATKSINVDMSGMQAGILSLTDSIRVNRDHIDEKLTAEHERILKIVQRYFDNRFETIEGFLRELAPGKPLPKPEEPKPTRKTRAKKVVIEPDSAG